MSKTVHDFNNVIFLSENNQKLKKTLLGPMVHDGVYKQYKYTVHIHQHQTFKINWRITKQTKQMRKLLKPQREKYSYCNEVYAATELKLSGLMVYSTYRSIDNHNLRIN